MKRKKEPIPKPRSSYIKVKCPECGNEQFTFSMASESVNCSICGTVLNEPTGGKAKLKGEVVQHPEP